MIYAAIRAAVDSVISRRKYETHTNHDYADSCYCKICGKLDSHHFDNCVCTYCGKLNHDWEYIGIVSVGEDLPCPDCGDSGQMANNGQWTTCGCVNKQWVTKYDHYRCRNCGTEKQQVRNEGN
jgi:hypothetical protein